MVLLDVRTAKTYRESDRIAADAIRLEPEIHVAARARELGLPWETWIVLYCT
jgi:hypothetical protein